MAAPRLRTKLAASRVRATEGDDEENKVKGRKAKAKGKAETDDEEADASEEDEETGASEGDEDETEASEGDEDEEASEEEEPKSKKAKSAKAVERARIQAITGSASAQHFPSLASHLAFETAMSAKAAGSLLNAAMKDVDTSASGKGGSKAEASSPKGAAFRRAMNGEAPNPKLGNGAAGGPEAARLMSFSEIRAARAAARK